MEWAACAARATSRPGTRSSPGSPPRPRVRLRPSHDYFRLMPATSLRPALAALAADPTSTTVRKLWKALTPDERAAAITAAMADDENGWVRTTTRAAVAGAIKFRPQTLATWPRQKLIAEADRKSVVEGEEEG